MVDKAELNICDNCIHYLPYPKESEGVYFDALYGTCKPTFKVVDYNYKCKEFKQKENDKEYN